MKTMSQEQYKCMVCERVWESHEISRHDPLRRACGDAFCGANVVLMRTFTKLDEPVGNFDWQESLGKNGKPLAVPRWSVKTLVGRLTASKVYSVGRQSGTRGKPTGYVRTSADRQTPIQNRGSSPNGRFAKWCVTVQFQGGSEVFYGQSFRSAALKAENYYRRQLKLAERRARATLQACAHPRGTS